MTDRGDWTLLLPVHQGTDVEALVDGSEAVGRTLVDLGIAGSWRPVEEAEVPALIVVARSMARHEAADLLELVAPDGVLYAEIPQRSLRHLRKTARTAGLAVVSVHGIAPDVSAPRRYLPLDSPSALAWYIRGLVIASSPLERLSQTIALTSLHVMRGCVPSVITHRFPHVAVVLTRPSFAAAAPSSRDVTTSNVILTSGQDAGSRSVIVEFSPRSRRPVSVTKVALRPEAAEATRRESLRTEGLRRMLPYRLAAALPRTVGEREFPQGLASVETCVRGTTLQSSAGRWGCPLRSKVADMRSAADWLVDLGRATSIMGGIEPPTWLSVFRDATELLEPSPTVRDMLAAAAAHLSRTPRCQRSVHVHGDPGPWNVYTERTLRRRVSVIDWEHDGSKAPLGPPLVDVLYLVTYWYFAVRRVSGRQEEQRALVELFAEGHAPNREARAAREVIARSAMRVGLGRSDVRPFVVALWANQAIEIRSREERLGIDRPSEPNRAEGYLAALAAAWKTEENT